VAAELVLPLTLPAPLLKLVEAAVLKVPLSGGYKLLSRALPISVQWVPEEEQRRGVLLGGTLERTVIMVGIHSSADLRRYMRLAVEVATPLPPQVPTQSRAPLTETRSVAMRGIRHRRMPLTQETAVEVVR